MVTPMTNPEPTMSTSHDLSLEAVRTDTNDDVPILEREAALNDESEPRSGEVAAIASDDPDVQYENRSKERCRTNDEYVIANELSNMIEELLDDIIRNSLHNMQSGTRSVVYNAVVKVMLDLLREDLSRRYIKRSRSEIIRYQCSC